MEKEIYLYPYSAAEARTRNELALWRASYQANEECARDIEEHIRTHFDGAHLDDSMLQPLLDKWGAVTVTLPEDSRIVLSASVTSVSSSTIIIFIVYLHSCYFLYSMKIFGNRYKNAKSVISINFYCSF